MSRPCKPVRYGDEDFPSLKALAAHCGVTAPSIYLGITRGTWRGKKVYYTEASKNAQVNRVYIKQDQFKWLHENKPEGASVDDMLSSIINNAMKAA